VSSYRDPCPETAVRDGVGDEFRHIESSHADSNRVKAPPETILKSFVFRMSQALGELVDVAESVLNDPNAALSDYHEAVSTQSRP
jgi:hypothetical protein